MKWYSASDYYKDLFGTKVYKLAIDAGCTCPTRDGSLGTRGCIFCSPSGSGDFCSDRRLSVSEQIEAAKILVSKKLKTGLALDDGRGDRFPPEQKKSSPKYIAYFQNFTNTYGDEKILTEKYKEALACPDVAGISIATRPDCISDSILKEIAKLPGYVSIELGFQTASEESARYIRRGFTDEVYFDAVKRIKVLAPDVHIVTHLIFGIPGEKEEDMLASVKAVVNAGSHGVKFTVLHVLSGTDLARDYGEGKFSCMEKEEYFYVLKKALEFLPPDMVIHRLTGDGPKKILIAPMWTADKKRVYNELMAYLKS